MHVRTSARTVCALIAVLFPLVAHGANKTWTTEVSGDFTDPARWTGGVPGANDSATFSAFDTGTAYTVTFDNAPNPLANPVLNQDLFFQVGTVIFTSGSGGPYTYHLTGAGGDDALITGGMLILGTSGNPLHMMVDDDLVIRGSSTLNVRFGSQVNTLDLLLATTGGNGTVVVDGAGSQLNVTNNISAGLNGNVGVLTYRNSAAGTLSGVTLANSGNAASAATLNLESDADLTTGNLNVGIGSAAATGTINVNGTGSTLTQTGASTITVGTAAAGIGNINIGTAASGATLTTGTGLTTINARGTVTVGSGATSGTLDVNGDFTINGGMLQLIESGSAVNLAAGKTMTVQSGGRVSFTNHSIITAANTIYNVNGADSTVETVNLGSVSVGSGAQMNVSAGGSVTSAEFLDVALTGGDGTLVVDGVGSSAGSNFAGGTRNIWGYSGHTATVTFSNSATGIFNNGLSLASNTDAGTTAVVDVLSGADLSVGSIGLATLGGATTSATLNVQDSGSTVVLTGASTLTVGHDTSGTAVINIGTTASGATFTTGTSLTEIRATGTVNVGSGANTGTFNVNGDFAINGGELNVGQFSGFVLNAGKTMTIVDGGRASFGGPYTTAANAVYSISGLNSTLETVGGGSIQINDGAEVNVVTDGISGGLLASASILSIATSGDGTLIVNGPGATVTAAGGGQHNWAIGGNTATVEFRNGATGTFTDQINLAASPTSGTTANLTIESGADLTAGGLLLAGLFGTTVSATATITDSGSTLTLTPSAELIVGNQFDQGVAIVLVADGGTLTVGAGGTTILKASGTINIDGGLVDLKTLNHQGGIINFLAGSLSFFGDLTVGVDGLFGGDVALTNAHELILDGTTTVDPLHTLTLSGGSLSTGSLVVNGTLAFNSGTLSITGAGGLTIGAGGPLGAAFTLGAGRTLNVTNTATVSSGALLVLESGGTFSAGTLANNGTVVLDGIAAVLGGTAVTNNGLMRGEGVVTASVTNAAAGEIRAQNAKTLSLIGANGTNAGIINLQGGTLEFAQPITNGANGQILGRGTLSVGGTGLNNQGHVALSSGITDVFGDVNNDTGSNTTGITISGNADVTFWDDVTHAVGSLFRVSAGSSATFFGTFAPAGSITGTGDVYIEADLTPGASPASVAFGGDLFLGANASLRIELGGTTLGSQFDHVEVAGAATLDGALDVSLIDGFAPALGDSFEVLHAEGGIFGAFAGTSLPALSAGLDWNLVYSNFSVLVQVAAIGLPGDYNANGVVDAADYVVWRDNEGTSNALPNDPIGGEIGTPQYDQWRAHFGRTAASGSWLGATGSARLTSASSVESSSPKSAGAEVPEGSSWLLALLAAAFRTPTRTSRVRRGNLASGTRLGECRPEARRFPQDPADFACNGHSPAR